MPMILLPHVHLASTGDHIAADGTRAPITRKDLEEMVLSHNNKVHNPPIVLGHKGDDPQRVPKNDSQPRFGFPHRLYIIDDLKAGISKLYGDLKIMPVLAKLIKDGAYYARSISFYGKHSPVNPTPGLKHLRHIAMLGAVPPAIKGLEDIVEFSEGESVMTTIPTESEKINVEGMQTLEEPDLAKQLSEALTELQESNKKEYSESETTEFQEGVESTDTQKFMDENASSILMAVLAEGDSGYKGEIVAFNPQPSLENNYLYDQETGIISGQFIDDGDEVFNFMIDTNAGTKEFQPQLVDEPTEDFSEVRAELGEGKGELMVDPMVRIPSAKMESKELKRTPTILETGMEVPLANDQIQNRQLKETLLAEKAELEGMMAKQEEEERMKKEQMMSADLQELKMLREQVKQLRESLTANRRVELTSFAEKCYSEGKLSQGSIPQDDLVSLLVAMDDLKNTTVSFSEGEEKKEGSMLTAFQNFITNLPNAVEFSEVLPEKTDYAKGIDLSDSNAIHEAAMKYCANPAHGLSASNAHEYMEAVKIVKFGG